MGNKFYITTAIAYTSRKPHIGNTYEIVLTDALARFKRMIGDDVFFLTGTDEHGQKIQQLAEAEGIEPQKYVDNVAGEVRKIWDLMNISSEPLMIIMKRPFRKSLKSSMIRAIFIRTNTRDGTVFPVKAFSQTHRLPRVTCAPTADVPYRRQRKKHISSK